jgi:hypothetical protein
MYENNKPKMLYHFLEMMMAHSPPTTGWLGSGTVLSNQTRTIEAGVANKLVLFKE